MADQCEDGVPKENDMSSLAPMFAFMSKLREVADANACPEEALAFAASAEGDNTMSRIVRLLNEDYTEHELRKYAPSIPVSIPPPSVEVPMQGAFEYLFHVTRADRELVKDGKLPHVQGREDFKHPLNRLSLDPSCANLHEDPDEVVYCVKCFGRELPHADFLQACTAEGLRQVTLRETQIFFRLGLMSQFAGRLIETHGQYYDYGEGELILCVGIARSCDYAWDWQAQVDKIWACTDALMFQPAAPHPPERRFLLAKINPNV